MVFSPSATIPPAAQLPGPRSDMAAPFSNVHLFIEFGKITGYDSKFFFIEIELPIPYVFKIAGDPEKITIIGSTGKLEKVIAVGAFLFVLDDPIFRKFF